MCVCVLTRKSEEAPGLCLIASYAHEIVQNCHMTYVYMSAVLESRQSVDALHTWKAKSESVLLYSTSYNQFCSNQSLEYDLWNDIIGEWSNFCKCNFWDVLNAEEVRHGDVTAGVKRPWNVITADKYNFFHS